mmetsp:Transcript_54601/g.152369  ORF Transcript_54601/g.152369 Transcript_54601/m.152369 type:complete len:271 (+) Transcript_54601:795-1607(+)
MPVDVREAGVEPPRELRRLRVPLPSELLEAPHALDARVVTRGLHVLLYVRGTPVQTNRQLLHLRVAFPRRLLERPHTRGRLCSLLRRREARVQELGGTLELRMLPLRSLLRLPQPVQPRMQGRRWRKLRDGAPQLLVKLGIALPSAAGDCSLCFLQALTESAELLIGRHQATLQALDVVPDHLHASLINLVLRVVLFAALLQRSDPDEGLVQGRRRRQLGNRHAQVGQMACEALEGVGVGPRGGIALALEGLDAFLQSRVLRHGLQGCLA